MNKHTHAYHSVRRGVVAGKYERCGGENPFFDVVGDVVDARGERSVELRRVLLLTASVQLYRLRRAALVAGHHEVPEGGEEKDEEEEGEEDEEEEEEKKAKKR